MVKGGINVVASTLEDDDLAMISTVYPIGETFHPEIPRAGATILQNTPTQVGIYHQFLMVGLRFPVARFIEDILSFYQIQICQVFPNGLRKIVGFALLCRALGIPLDVALFRHFYYHMYVSDWITFSPRPGLVDPCFGLPDSIKGWKNEFFFISTAAFEKVLPPGVPRRGSGKNEDRPYLSASQKRQVKLISEHRVRWSDPSEVELGMAGLSPVWLARRQRPVIRVDGEVVSLLDILTKGIPEGPLRIFTVEIDPDEVLIHGFPVDHGGVEVECAANDDLVVVPRANIPPVGIIPKPSALSTGYYPTLLQNLSLSKMSRMCFLYAEGFAIPGAGHNLPLLPLLRLPLRERNGSSLRPLSPCLTLLPRSMPRTRTRMKETPLAPNLRPEGTSRLPL